jgi:hypothetical protein
MSDWLDLELSNELAPVAAPDELWHRVRSARRPQRPVHRVFALPVAAVVTLILAGALWFMARGQQASGVRQLPSVAHSECLLCHNTI